MAGTTAKKAGRAKVAETVEDASDEGGAADRGGLGKRELVDRVTAETGLKKRDVKTVADALLAAMGQALSEGQSLNLEPLGKLRVAKSTGTDERRVLTCKLRRKGAPAPAE